ncbi:ABC transporter substrate-binding protein [Oceanotoga sp. DSM 15011]|jgi:branched-chain amino acid transport system substrate-binding protein|uniref:Amino acid/amide ABC transporter substrate-binding protein (HAAT family) n=1 Tax=Oceanotoga teriensis TaxID=515440 RepID=A0AA45C6K5_9BACT|nr:MULTISPECIES: ABC transporter substrate-binding protein [Oceanotoga]MDN5342553.1 branched-chain amino acid transport system substrate-binding protein [Oceanotoga sp.]MDO7977049.1 ABC transporter substrate-binding protein [Oceanotoga teriensis]PWJ92165.1 amino acid/amide ABC transporter substrate-binding protein (HAAT family) [Oceanotoga teriensis]UYO99380.1 ABC transporter substrate-binding protein [Oceanotoga sp. DSM 15011]
MKKALSLIFIIILIVSAFSANPWKIGVLGPYQTENGVWIKESVQMAADEINAQGGIVGRPVELVFVDDENTAGKMISGITRLVTRDKIDFLIGGVGSGPVLAAMDTMARYKVIWLGTGAASPDITNKVAENFNKYKYYFRVGTLDSISQGRSIGEFIANYLVPEYGIKKAAIISLDLVYSKGIAEKAAEIAEKAGVEIVYRDYFPAGTNDFSATFKRAEEAGAQVIIDAIVTEDGIQFTKQWYDLKVNAAIVGAIAPALKPEFFNQTNQKSIYETSAYPNGGPAPLTSKTLKWYEDYKTKFGHAPGFIAFPSYNTLYVLKEALENTKNLNDKDEIIKAIEKVEFPLGGDKGVAPVIFTENHDLKYGGNGANGIIYQWNTKGEWKAVWPLEYKTGDWLVPEWINW